MIPSDTLPFSAKEVELRTSSKQFSSFTSISISFRLCAVSRLGMSVPATDADPASISEELMDSAKLIAFKIFVTIVFTISPKIRVQTKYTTIEQMVEIS